jgi:hypothetical protein
MAWSIALSGVMLALAGTSLPTQPVDEWIQGRWYWELPSGDPRLGGYSRYTFDDGKLLREGYPPLQASARYEVDRVQGNRAWLALSEADGEHGYLLGDRLQLELDQMHDQMMIGGQGPYRREP